MVDKCNKNDSDSQLRVEIMIPNGEGIGNSPFVNFKLIHVIIPAHDKF